MATSIPIRLMRSTDGGAGTLSGAAAGNLITILDALLVNGYNSKTITITRSGTTATATATAHGFPADGLTIVRHSGANETDYNGDFQIFNVTANTYDFTVANSPATPATGTITAKVAPLDWTKPFSGTNKAVYRAPSGNRYYLRVDDANPNADSNKSANLRGFETMTDVDTGTGLFPTTAQMTSGIPLNKSATADSTARSWVLLGDGYSFHFFYANAATAPNVYREFYFGDPASELSSDPFGTMIYGDSGVATNSPENSSAAYAVQTATATFTTQAAHYFARLYSQVGGSVVAGKIGNVALAASGGTVGGNSIPLVYPSPGNNSMYVSPIFVHDSSIIRAQLKSKWQPLHTRPLGHGGTLTVSQSPIGRRTFSVATAGATSTPGETIMDLDGPWR